MGHEVDPSISFSKARGQCPALAAMNEEQAQAMYNLTMRAALRAEGQLTQEHVETEQDNIADAAKQDELHGQQPSVSEWSLFGASDAKTNDVPDQSVRYSQTAESQSHSRKHRIVSLVEHAQSAYVMRKLLDQPDDVLPEPIISTFFEQVQKPAESIVTKVKPAPPKVASRPIKLAPKNKPHVPTTVAKPVSVTKISKPQVSLDEITQIQEKKVIMRAEKIVEKPKKVEITKKPEKIVIKAVTKPLKKAQLPKPKLAVTSVKKNSTVNTQESLPKTVPTKRDAKPMIKFVPKAIRTPLPVKEANHSIHSEATKDAPKPKDDVSSKMSRKEDVLPVEKLVRIGNYEESKLDEAIPPIEHNQKPEETIALLEARVQSFEAKIIDKVEMLLSDVIDAIDNTNSSKLENISAKELDLIAEELLIVFDSAQKKETVARLVKMIENTQKDIAIYSQRVSDQHDDGTHEVKQAQKQALMRKLNVLVGNIHGMLGGLVLTANNRTLAFSSFA